MVIILAKYNIKQPANIFIITFLMDISKTTWEDIENNKEKYIQEFIR